MCASKRAQIESPGLSGLSYLGSTRNPVVEPHRNLEMFNLPIYQLQRLFKVVKPCS
jgi:hypothetical protein